MALLGTDSTEATDLRGALVGGLVNESVMQTITDISKIPLPLTNMIGSGSHGNNYHSWTKDKLQAVDIANQEIDGRDSSTDQTNIGTRVGNYSTISTKDISVSTRADASDTIGFAKATAYQMRMRNEELHRDVEAMMLSNNASLEGTAAAASTTGGLNAWIETNIGVAATPGTAGGFDAGIVAAYTAGTKEALSEEKVRNVAQAVYEEGGNPTVMMMTPSVCRRFSEYLFTSSARIATLTSETTQSKEAATAKGSVNVFVTDFGVTLDLIPNRLQQDTAAGVSTAFLIDPSKLELSFLSGYRSERLSKKGLSEQWLMSVDWTLVVHAEEAHGMIPDIDNTLACVAVI